MLTYHSVPSKHPWVLGIHEPKWGVGSYTTKPIVRITQILANHRLINFGGVGTYTEKGAY